MDNINIVRTEVQQENDNIDDISFVKAKTTNDEDIDIGLDLLANPKKTLSPQHKQHTTIQDSVQEHETLLEEGINDNIENDLFDDNMDNKSVGFMSHQQTNNTMDQNSIASQHSRPVFYDSKPKKSPKQIMQEKQDLLLKLDDLERRGMRVSRKYTMADNLEDIEFEYFKFH